MKANIPYVFLLSYWSKFEYDKFSKKTLVNKPPHQSYVSSLQGKKFNSRSYRNDRERNGEMPVLIVL